MGLESPVPRAGVPGRAQTVGTSGCEVSGERAAYLWSGQVSGGLTGPPAPHLTWPGPAGGAAKSRIAASVNTVPLFITPTRRDFSALTALLVVCETPSERGMNDEEQSPCK